MSKIVTIAVGACAYVLGARAGRERYEQIRDQAKRLWRDPRVQEKTDQAAVAIKDKTDQAATAIKDKAAPAVKEQVSKTARQVAEKAKSGSKSGDSTNG
jgi:F0F1-type ATP synthase membrane subunit b/b'